MKSLRTRFTFLLALSALGLATISCDTTGQDEFTDDMSALRSVSGNLLIHEDFSGNNVFSQVHQQFGARHAFKIVEDPKDKSNKVGRFELRMDDPIQSNGKRSEVLFPAQDGKDRWYSYSLYLPGNGFKKDSNNDIITQWHQSGGGSPATTLRVHEDNFIVRSGNKKEDRKDFDLGPVEKDVWHDFVFHIVHSSGSDGLLEVWHNGEKVLEEKGGNMYDLAMPRWKIGIYKASWASRETDTDVRVMMFDNIKLGNDKTTLEEMTPQRNNSAEASASSSSSSSSSSSGSGSSSSSGNSSSNSGSSATSSVPAPAPTSAPAPSTAPTPTPTPAPAPTSAPAPQPPVANLPAPRTPAPDQNTAPKATSSATASATDSNQVTPTASSTTASEQGNSEEENH